MSKSISIKQDGVASNFSDVEKINTKLMGGGSENWLPEDETECCEITIDANGEYVPYTYGKYAFWKVNVMVPGGGGAEIDTTVNIDGYNMPEQVTGGSSGSESSGSSDTQQETSPISPTQESSYVTPPASSSSNNMGCGYGSIAWSDGTNDYTISVDQSGSIVTEVS